MLVVVVVGSVVCLLTASRRRRCNTVQQHTPGTFCHGAVQHRNDNIEAKNGRNGKQYDHDGMCHVCVCSQKQLARIFAHIFNKKKRNNTPQNTTWLHFPTLPGEHVDVLAGLMISHISLFSSASLH